MNPVTLHYSEDLLRKAARAYWWRLVGWNTIVILVLVAAATAYLASKGWRSWIVGFGGSTVLFVAVAVTVSYFMIRNAAIARVKRINPPQAVLEAREEGLRATSSIGTSQIAWKDIKSVWRYSNFWLVRLSASEFMTLPLKDIDEETSSFILAKVRDNGGKVA